MWKKNLEEGLREALRTREDGKPYDMILTDMEYPLESNGDAKADAGERLIEAMKAEGVMIPVIVISSVNYRGNPPAGAKAAVFYRERDTSWQRELLESIRSAGA